MSEPFLGEIRMFGGNFAPRGWALCNGQLLSIAQNTALFSILGTTYGGNGQTTFALPNLQGRVPMHWGAGPGLTPRTLGETGGTENVTLLLTQIPQHNHPVNAAATATSASPAGAVPATVAPPRGSGGAAQNAYAAAPDGATVMNNGMVGQAGGSQPHANIQPFQCVTFIIALEGIFPSRN